MSADAYLHIGMPRFQRLEDALAIMDDAGIERAAVCPFTTCPDLREVHRALVQHPKRFLAFGLPIGRDRAEVEAGVRAQFAAGFTGLRLAGEDAVPENEWLLDLIGEHDGVVLLAGYQGLVANEAVLRRHLQRFESGLVLAAHLAGPREIGVFDSYPGVAELFAHERFAAVISRHGLFTEPMISQWGAELVARVGWDRLLWGSEAPVLHWRDESIATAQSWFERFEPSQAQREAVLGGNFDRLLVARPRPQVTDLDLPFDPLDLTVPAAAPMWPVGLDLDSSLPGRMVQGWVQWGGPDRGPLRHYLESVLDSGLPR